MKPPRLEALDVFRGLTIAGMLLVNTPGSWDYVYGPLDHAPWHGWTPTDLIFPFFLFIVGVSLVFSFERRIETGASRPALARKSLTRALSLFALGLLLNGFPRYDLGTLRVMGVLQRIALVYLATAFLYLYAGARSRRWWAAILLLGHWAALSCVPVPGVGAGVLERQGNLAQYVDALILGAHRWKPDWDPEGVLSTFPAIATCLLGVGCGELLRDARGRAEQVVDLFGWGVIGMLAGVTWSIWLPINKNLWTGSYVLFTGGCAALVLATCLWLVDMRSLRIWARPFVAMGVNPILLFVGSGLFTRVLLLLKVGEDGTKVSSYTWIYDHAFVTWAGPWHGSLLFAVAYVGLFCAVAVLLHRRGWLVRI